MNKKPLFFGAVAVSLAVFFGAAMLFNASRSGGGGAVSDVTIATLDRAHAASLVFVWMFWVCCTMWSALGRCSG